MSPSARCSAGGLRIWQSLPRPVQQQARRSRRGGALLLVAAAAAVGVVSWRSSNFVSPPGASRKTPLRSPAIGGLTGASMLLASGLPAIADEEFFNPNLATDSKMISDDFFNNEVTAQAVTGSEGSLGQFWNEGLSTAAGLALGGDFGNAWSMFSDTWSETGERFWERVGDGDPPWDEMGSFYLTIILLVNVPASAYYLFSWLFGVDMRALGGYEEFPDPFKEGTRAARAAAEAEEASKPQQGPSTWSRRKKKKKIVNDNDLFLPPREGETLPEPTPEPEPVWASAPTAADKLAEIRAQQQDSEPPAPKVEEDPFTMEDYLARAEEFKSAIDVVAPEKYKREADKFAKSVVPKPEVLNAEKAAVAAAAAAPAPAAASKPKDPAV